MSSRWPPSEAHPLQWPLVPAPLSQLLSACHDSAVTLRTPRVRGLGRTLKGRRDEHGACRASGSTLPRTQGTQHHPAPAQTGSRTGHAGAWPPLGAALSQAGCTGNPPGPWQPGPRLALAPLRALRPTAGASRGSRLRSLLCAQCRLSKGRNRGFCWCVDKYGQPLPGYYPKGKGYLQCDSEEESK